ncbi:group 1 glycosyl transferase [Salinarchaeum sp. Harcht-Bsk1]|nr:group 1 glycosyl transferase [Salinarchaeum sp. Harcht-Bsk1]
MTTIATPGDASCGIGTYARDLRAALEDLEPDRRRERESGATVSGSDGPTTSETPGASGASGTADGPAVTDEPGRTDGLTTTDAIDLEQDYPTAGHFISIALRAAARDSDVVHVQHEYGLFRRPGSSYPGLYGLLFFPVLWLATRIRRKALVVTLHSVLSPAPEEARFAKRCYLLVMHELIARVTDHVIFLSSDCEEQFHEDVAQDPTEYSVLPHGVNVRDSSPADRSTARERFGFDPDDEIVVIPGFVRPPKGHDIFVDVAKQLPDVEFLIAGGARPKGFDQEFVDEVEADAPSNVTITGVLDDEEFPMALATADLALLPYRVVTQSGTFNWCAAEELPVLASDRSYFRQIEAEWDALETIGLDDTAAIADRVATLLEDDEQRDALASGIRTYKEANSFETVAAEHLQIYRRILAGVPARRVDDAEGGTTRIPVEDESMLAACSAQREATVSSD